MNELRPCSYCGHSQFLYVPNVAIDAAFLTTMMGMKVMETVQGKHRWVFTIVSCTQCGNSLLFTTDMAGLQTMPGAKVIAAGGP